jgi:hypothetical protein
MRAQWQVDAGQTSAATRSLLWHENYDLVGQFDGVMEAADVDAAFGTVGRWYRARLDRGDNPGSEVCGALAGIWRLWAGGDPPYQRRAHEARTAIAEQHCVAP